MTALTDLSEHERVSPCHLGVYGVESIHQHCLRLELLPYGVGWESEHVHFHISAYLLVRQKLTRHHLQIRSLSTFGHEFRILEHSQQTVGKESMDAI